ncbi:unnamed protein product, partial [Menidia menidia]
MVAGPAPFSASSPSSTSPSTSSPSSSPPAGRSSSAVVRTLSTRSIRMHGPGPSQDPSQAPGERGELLHSLSKETSGSPEASELGSPRCVPNFDLFNMVVSYKRMALFLEPVADGVEDASVLAAGFSGPELGWLAVAVAGVAAPGALGYLQDRCGGRASEAELQRRRHHAVHRRDLQTVHLTKQEAMLEVKDLLKHLDDMLASACQSAEAVYRVLYWDDHTTSSRFYGALLTVACLLYVAPVGLVLAGLNTASPASEAAGEEQEPGGLLDRTPTPTSLEDLSPGSVEEAEEAEPDDEFKDAIEENSVSLQEDDDGPLGAPEYDTVSENGLLSRNEPIRSKVSKLTEKL